MSVMEVKLDIDSIMYEFSYSDDNSNDISSDDVTYTDSLCDDNILFNDDTILNNNKPGYVITRPLSLYPLNTLEYYHEYMIYEYITNEIKCCKQNINNNNNINNIEDDIILSWLNTLEFDKNWKNIFNNKMFTVNFKYIMENSLMILVVLSKLNVPVDINEIIFGINDDKNRDIAFNEMNNIGIKLNKDCNYLEIYYKLILYDSLSFLNIQDRKIEDNIKLNECYLTNKVGLFCGYSTLWDIVSQYIAGEYAYSLNEYNESIDIKSSIKRVNDWFNTKLIRYIGNNNIDNIPIDEQIFMVLKSMKYVDNISEININKQIEYAFKLESSNILNNITILLQLLSNLNIINIELNATHLIGINSNKWFDIIKANIMKYCVDKSFNYNNWS